MKKSNWREELDAPSAVKKTINEFVVTGGGILTIAKGLGLGTALKTVVGTTAGKVTLGALGGAAVTKAVGTSTQERDRNRRYPGVPHTGHHIGRRQNPR